MENTTELFEDINWHSGWVRKELSSRATKVAVIERISTVEGTGVGYSGCSEAYDLTIIDEGSIYVRCQI
jgi:hypothetical protein